jgi:hypothetical protein
MIKLILKINPRKISGTFYAKSCEKNMEFEEKVTRKLKEKHSEFFTRDYFKKKINCHP